MVTYFINSFNYRFIILISILFCSCSQIAEDKAKKINKSIITSIINEWNETEDHLNYIIKHKRKDAYGQEILITKNVKTNKYQKILELMVRSSGKDMVMYNKDDIVSKKSILLE